MLEVTLKGSKEELDKIRDILYVGVLDGVADILDEEYHGIIGRYCGVPIKLTVEEDKNA